MLVIALGKIFWQQTTIKRLREDNGSSPATAEKLERLRAENDRLSKMATDSDELARLRGEHSELLRLRGETARLRQALKTQSANSNLRKKSTSPAIDSPVET